MMRSIGGAIAVAVLLAARCWSGLAACGEKDAKSSNDPRGLVGTRHSVEARVIHPNRPRDPTVQAELQPGPFTIPEGYKAIDLKFHSGDPKTGYESDVLRPGNIKCVKSKRPPTKEGFKAGMELAAGEYLLIVGGFPGAVGGLSYTLVPDDSTKPPSGPGGDGRQPDRHKASQLVTIHSKGTTITGETKSSFDVKTQARLTIADEKFELEFLLEVVRSESIVSERSTIRWQGKVLREDGGLRVRGTTRADHVWNDKWGGQGFSRGSGTFEGRLTGSTWSGTMKENGETKASQVDKAESYRMDSQWSIDASVGGKVARPASSDAPGGKTK